MTIINNYRTWSSHPRKYSVNNKKRNQVNKIGHPKVGHIWFFQIKTMYQEQNQCNDAIHQSVCFVVIDDSSKYTYDDKKVLDIFLKWFYKINLDIGLDTCINKHTGIRHNHEE